MLIMDMDTSPDPAPEPSTAFVDPATAAYWSQYYQQCYQQAGGYNYGGGYTDPWPTAATPPPPPTQPPPPPPDDQPPPPPSDTQPTTLKRSRKDDKNKIKIKLLGAEPPGFGAPIPSTISTTIKSELPANLPPMPMLPGNLPMPPLTMLFGGGTMPSKPPTMPLIPGMSDYADTEPMRSADYPDFSSAPGADVKYESPSRNGRAHSGPDDHNNYNRRGTRSDQSPNKGFSKRPPPPNDKRPPPPTERSWAQVASHGPAVAAPMDYTSHSADRAYNSDPSTQQISNISPEHLADCLSSDYPNLGDNSKRPAYLSDDSKRPAYLTKRPEASNKRPYPNSPASKDRDRRYSNGEGYSNKFPKQDPQLDRPSRFADAETKFNNPNADTPHKFNNPKSRFSDSPAMPSNNYNTYPAPNKPLDIAPATDMIPAKPKVPPTNPKNWPEPLKDYVKRCFESCLTEVQKDEAEKFLKDRLRDIDEDGSIWTTDWDTAKTYLESKNDKGGADAKVGFSWGAGGGRHMFQARRNPLQNVSSQGPQNNRTADKEPPQQPLNRKSGFSMFNPKNVKSRIGERGEEGEGSKLPSSVVQKKEANSLQASLMNIANKSTNSFGGRGGLTKGVGRGRGQAIDVGDSPGASKITGPANGRGRGRGKRGNKNQTPKANNNNNNNIMNTGFDTEEKKEGRATRFKKELFTVSDTISSMMESANKMGGEDVHFSDTHIIGTNQSLEKPYLRLTSAPTADQVRAEGVLVKSLENVMMKWKRDQNYAFVCEQLKSIRQDLTIQAIKNNFAIKVYEVHARIALEKSDTTEYNQCQTRLIELYPLNTEGNRLEFLAYRILYYIYIQNNSDALKLIAKLNRKDKESPEVKHAVCVYNSWASGNYKKFFQLYRSAPKMGGYLMDCYIQRERVEVIKKMVRAYKPTVSVGKVGEVLGYPDAATTLVLLDQCSVKYTNPKKSHVDCKNTVIEV